MSFVSIIKKNDLFTSLGEDVPCQEKPIDESHTPSNFGLFPAVSPVQQHRFQFPCPFPLLKQLESGYERYILFKMCGEEYVARSFFLDPINITFLSSLDHMMIKAYLHDLHIVGESSLLFKFAASFWNQVAQPDYGYSFYQDYLQKMGSNFIQRVILVAKQKYRHEQRFVFDLDIKWRRIRNHVKEIWDLHYSNAHRLNKLITYLKGRSFCSFTLENARKTELIMCNYLAMQVETKIFSYVNRLIDLHVQGFAKTYRSIAKKSLKLIHVTEAINTHRATMTIEQLQKLLAQQARLRSCPGVLPYVFEKDISIILNQSTLVSSFDRAIERNFATPPARSFEQELIESRHPLSLEDMHSLMRHEILKKMGVFSSLFSSNAS